MVTSNFSPDDKPKERGESATLASECAASSETGRTEEGGWQGSGELRKLSDRSQSFDCALTICEFREHRLVAIGHLGSVRRVQLPHDVANVNLDSALTHVERVRDELIRSSLAKHADNGQLALGKDRQPRLRFLALAAVRSRVDQE